MQERFLGDIHDFGKFLLLCALTEEGAPSCKLGINWYLTCPQKVDPASNNDGNLRYHQGGGKEFESINRHNILENLRYFSEPENRKIQKLESMDFWPKGTKFFSEELSPTTVRDEWISRSRVNLSQCSLVFLDPDTGLETISSRKRPRRLPKYVLKTEVHEYLKKQQSVLFIQFVQHQTIDGAIKKVEANLALSDEIKVGIIHYRVAPTVLFFLLMQKSHTGAFISRLRRFIDDMEQSSIKKCRFVLKRP